VLSLSSFLGTLGALALWGLVRNFFPGYLNQKGQNLATKEDIAEITKRIEEVKHDYASLLEAQKQKGQLKFSALDKRLAVLQEAHVRWWHLLRSIHTPHVEEEVQKCQTFWVENRLYLSEEAAFAFRRAYMAASDHEQLKAMAREDRSQAQEVRENFARITEAESIIVRSAALPSWTEAISVAEELEKQA